jgi:hypothetical protein
MRRRGMAAALAVAVVIGGAGCDRVATSGASASRSVAQSRATSSAVPSATPSASAADGADVAACSDAACEVSVGAGTAFSLPKSVRVEALKVTAVTAGRVTLTGHGIGNSASGGCVGDCSAGNANGVFTFTLGDDSGATMNRLSVTVKDIANGSAILELRPR